MKLQKPLKNWDNIPTSSPFGLRRDPFTGQWRFHGGIDKACNNEETEAAQDGIIHLVAGKYGEVYIDHGNELRTVYAHMKGIPGGLRSGEIIKKGQFIGYTDTIGKATGPHLHFGVMLLPSLEAVDPNLYFIDEEDLMWKEKYEKLSKGYHICRTNKAKWKEKYEDEATKVKNQKKVIESGSQKIQNKNKQIQELEDELKRCRNAPPGNIWDQIKEWFSN